MIIEDAEERVSYDRRTILLHWIVAGTIAFMWLLARFNMSFLQKGPLRLNLWSIHVLVGFCLAALVVARIVWRLTRGDRLPPAEHGVRHVLAVAVHYLLYLLMIVVVVLGLAHVSGFRLFGVLPFPTFWEKPVNHEIGELHGLAANIIAGLAVLHALAALYHHHVVKDRVLIRMNPRLRRRG
ncbi:MAG: cytochrome [Sphingomonas bacterium]|jgi:cytochrome b561|nr:cytochrome [Sphingomonas bacterium]